MYFENKGIYSILTDHPINSALNEIGADFTALYPSSADVEGYLCRSAQEVSLSGEIDPLG
jgi:hypothetical protein